MQVLNTHITLNQIPSAYLLTLGLGRFRLFSNSTGGFLLSTLNGVQAGSMSESYASESLRSPSLRMGFSVSESESVSRYLPDN